MGCGPVGGWEHRHGELASRCATVGIARIRTNKFQILKMKGRIILKVEIMNKWDL
jgi:hypothetical protein